MTRAGRPARPGVKRTKSGRISRAGQSRKADKRVKGNPVAEQKLLWFGVDGADAIGRAYRCGLLGGRNDEAKRLMQEARALHAAYWAAFETGAVRSGLGAMIASAGSCGQAPESDVIARREARLISSLTAIKDCGVRVERLFREVVIDRRPDCGPDWLDRLCSNVHSGTPLRRGDSEKLDAFFSALRKIFR